MYASPGPPPIEILKATVQKDLEIRLSAIWQAIQELMGIAGTFGLNDIPVRHSGSTDTFLPHKPIHSAMAHSTGNARIELALAD